MAMNADQWAGITILGGLGYGMVQAAKGFRRGATRYEAKKDRWLLPKESHKYDANEAERWVMTFLSFSRPKSEWAKTGGQSEFVFRIVKDRGGAVRFYLDAPNDRLRGVQSNIPPTLEWHEVDKNVQKSPAK